MTGPAAGSGRTGPAAGSGRGGAMAAEDRAWLPVTDVATAGAVRRSAIALGTDAGMSDETLGQLAIVASEIATNLARHADRGVLQLRPRHDGGASGVEVLAMDSGPGMADLAASSRDGHSTGGTLGIGLGAIRRLAHEFDAYSLPDKGTVVAATVWQSHPTRDTGWVAGVSRPITGEDICGDGYAARDTGTRRQVLLCDGLGHGELASRASRAAVEAFHGAPDAAPAAVLGHVSQRVRHTRGGVAAIAEIADGQVRFAGIGNVGASIVDGSARQIMVSTPGIVGHQHREVRGFEYGASPGALVILHSDGVSDRWRMEDYPGLLTHSPAVVAATLLRDAGYRRDDAAVVVARVR